MTSSTLHRTPRPRPSATVALILSCAAIATSLQAETVVFDPTRTTVAFTLGDVLHTVRGSFKLKSGVIHFDSSTGKASGSVVVDATSGESGSGARDRRMHKNILESERYPEIVFMPDGVSGKIPGQGMAVVQVHGLFRIHGAGHEMTVPVQVQAEATQVTASTRFSVPYVKWGMKNPSTFFLKVNETVDLSVHAVGQLSAEDGSN